MKQLRIGVRFDQTPQHAPEPPDLATALRANIADRLGDRADQLRTALGAGRSDVSAAPASSNAGAAPEPPCLVKALAKHREGRRADAQ